MGKFNVYAEWQKLCKESEAVCDALDTARAVITHKFAAIAQGTSFINPTNAELLKFEEAQQALEDISRRMDAFVKKHT
jgi:hypothetical protein